jgi:hypothetical protein
VILDYETDAKVVDVLRGYLHSGSRLSVISACFFIYAFFGLKKEFSAIDSFLLSLTQPEFFEKTKTETERGYVIYTNLYNLYCILTHNSGKQN